MKDFPYLIVLLKKDVILWTIITTGSFTNINLNDIKHDYWTSQYLQINNYSLGNNEKFNEIWITLTDISTLISFRSSSSKYLDNTRFYFDDDTILDSSNPYYITDMKISNVHKTLNNFDIGLDMQIDITVGNSSLYGYYIDIIIYREDWIDKVKI